MASKPLVIDLDILKKVEENLSQKDYSVVEFAEELCNKRLYPRQALLLKLIFLEDLTEEEEVELDYWIAGGDGGNEVLISPLIRERRDWLKKRGYPHFREVVLVGGRRSSKGYMVGIIMGYKMFQAMKINFHEQFGIDEDKQVYFSCVSASQDQAKRFQYADFADTVTSCTSMQPNIFKVRELEFSVMTELDKRKIIALERAGTKVGRDISTLRGVAWAANAKTLRGSATLVIDFDEMAHMQVEGESYMTSEQVYDAAIPSLAQFGKHALIVCASSPYTKIGKFYERYTEALAVKEDQPLAPMMLTLQFPSWFLFGNYWKDKRKRFKSAITVSPDWDTDKKDKHGRYLLSAEDKDNIVIERENERQDPDKFKVERRGQWAEVMDSFLRPELVDRAFLGMPQENGQYQPLKMNWSYPQAGFRYIAHLDPSSTTAGFGFCLGHVEYIQGYDPDSGEERERPHAIIDIIQRWQASSFQDQIVDYEVVLHDIMQYLIVFQPHEVSLDQFQNAAIIGWLNKELRGKNLSGSIRVFERTATNKSNWDVACVFRDALYQDLIHIPSDTADSDWLALELKNLQQINTAGRHPRVDAPTVGPIQTKDCYSALSQVVWALIGEEMAGQVKKDIGEIRMALGSQGGYSLGNATNPDFPRVGGELGQRLASYYRRKAVGASAGDPTSAARYGTWARGRRGRLGGRRGRRY